MDNNYKRQYRQLNDTTKQKISQSLRGRTKSGTHTQAISNVLKKYWATVTNQPNNFANFLLFATFVPYCNSK